MVWIRLRPLRRKPSLSASKMATRDTSGMSKPSRSRLMPPARQTPQPQIPDNLHALHGVNVVVHVPHPDAVALQIAREILGHFFRQGGHQDRSPFSTRRLISEIKSSICPSVGLTVILGSKSPVGRMTCSTTWADFSSSRSPGVALTKMAWLSGSKTHRSSRAGCQRRRAAGSRS